MVHKVTIHVTCIHVQMYIYSIRVYSLVLGPSHMFQRFRNSFLFACKMKYIILCVSACICTCMLRSKFSNLYLALCSCVTWHVPSTPNIVQCTPLPVSFPLDKHCTCVLHEMSFKRISYCSVIQHDLPTSNRSGLDYSSIPCTQTQN